MNRPSELWSLLDPSVAVQSAALTLLLAGAAACGSIGEGPTGPTTEQDRSNATGQRDGDGAGDVDGSDGGADGPGAPPADTPCDELARATERTLQASCGSCHSGGVERGGFGSVLDVDAMIRDGFVKRGDAEGSILYTKIKSGEMPLPPSPAPNAGEVATLRAWIEAGACSWNATPVGPAAAYMGVNDRIRIISADVSKFFELGGGVTTSDKIRYIDFSHLSNQGYDETRLSEVRQATSLSLNSVSYNNRVVPLTFIDPGRLIARVNLDDFKLDASDWERIVEDYPYAITYEFNGAFGFVDETKSDEIRRFTETNKPIVQADWLISNITRPPLYYDLLGFSGKSLDRIAKDIFDVNIADNVARVRVARAGFRASGVSVNNRIIERHVIPGGQGPFWLSYDFAGNANRQNITAFPLSFEEDGGEVICTLPNGLQCYIVSAALTDDDTDAAADNGGTLLEKAPTAIVKDPHSRDGAVEAGISCMNCHGVNGMISKQDEVHGLGGFSESGANVGTLIDTLYLEPQAMNLLFERDTNSYTSARTAAGAINIDGLTMHRLDGVHLGTMNLNAIAGVLGVSSDELASALRRVDFQDPSVDLAEFATLEDGGSVNREVFDAKVGRFVEQIELGKPID